MARPIKNTDTFKHPLYPHARCFIFKGVIYTQINSGGKRVRETTGLKFTGVARTDVQIKKQALAILESRILNKPEPHKRQESLSVYRAFDAFFSEYYHNDLQKGRARDLRTALKLYFPEDTPLATELLRDMLTARRNELGKTYASNTIRKHLQCLRMMFDYAHERAWIERNPITSLMIPDEIKQAPNPLTITDLRRICEQIVTESNRSERYHAYPRVANELMLMGLTGLRPFEFLALDWTCFTDKFIEVRKAKGNRPRRIAIDLIPNLRETLQSLMQYKSGTTVSVWKNTQNYNDLLKRICKELNIPARTLYNLRDTALNYWRDELKLNADVRSYMGGNNMQTQKDHYLLEYEIEKFTSSVSLKLT